MLEEGLEGRGCEQELAGGPARGAGLPEPAACWCHFLQERSSDCGHRAGWPAEWSGVFLQLGLATHGSLQRALVWQTSRASGWVRGWAGI